MSKDKYRKPMRFENHPLYKKASYISELSFQIADVVKKEAVDQTDEYYRATWENLAQFIREDAMMMTAKVAGGVGADLYDILMENAAIIRKCAKDIQLHLTGLEIHEYKDLEYLDLLRDEIEEFRILFAEWVKTFDPWNYYIDRWGLFNPPGVNYDDPDPDDNLPMNTLFDEIDGFDEIDPDDWDELDDDDEV